MSARARDGRGKEKLPKLPENTRWKYLNLNGNVDLNNCVSNILHKTANDVRDISV
jgi:hypothetical protein